MNTPANDNHGRKRSAHNKAAAKLAVALIKDTIAYNERRRARIGRNYLEKPTPQGMTPRQYMRALRAYEAQNRFSARHPFITGLMFLGALWLFAALVG